jgi:hypothetical protein
LALDERGAGGLFIADLKNRQLGANRDGEKHWMSGIRWKFQTVQFLPRADPTSGAVGIVALLGSQALLLQFQGLPLEA